MAAQIPQRNWWQRNWKWFVPTLLVVGFALIAGFILLILTFVMSMMKSIEPYRHSVGDARENAAVTAALGEPIQEGWLVGGHFEESGGSGTASLSIPLTGPKGEATLYVEASKSGGQWQYQTEAVELKASGQRIDLQPH